MNSQEFMQLISSWKGVLCLSILFFMWGAGATPLSIALAKTFRILDMPGGRKKHSGIIPRGGGLVCWTGYLFLSFILLKIYPEMVPIATGATAVFLVGYIDDMRELPALMKLVVHLLASGLVVWFLPICMSLKILFLLWIAGGTSAYNLVDGINGLALSLFMLSCIFGAIMIKITIFFPLAAIAFGIFLWNYPTAKTFLGDGGSTLLGFVCMSHVAFGIYPFLENENILVNLLSLFMIGGMPFLDTLWSAARRVALRRSPFSPDRGHLHFILLDKSFKMSQTLFLLLLLHGCMVVLGYKLLVGKS